MRNLQTFHHVLAKMYCHDNRVKVTTMISNFRKSKMTDSEILEDLEGTLEAIDEKYYLIRKVN